MQQLLEGHQEYLEMDERDEIIASLRAQNRKLDEALRLERNRVGQAEHGVKELRKILTPLHRALQAVFGEIEEMGLPDGGSPERSNPKWESWKSKMPGRPAEFIDLLLLHGTMNRNQLMAAAHCGKDVVRVTISKLNVAGLLNKNGGQYSLKEL
jgi:hypothetical protein